MREREREIEKRKKYDTQRERYAVRGEKRMRDTQIREREMLWKLRCSVGDPNYGITLGILITVFC